MFDEDDLPTMKPFNKYSFEKKQYEPVKIPDLRDKMKKLTDEFKNAPCWEPRRSDLQKRETTWSTSIGSKGQPIIKREELTYTLPTTGNTFRKSSITESSNYESKPPLSMRTRRSSIGSGEEFSSSRSSFRSRKYSEESSSSGLPPRPTRYSTTTNDDDATVRFHTAQKMRDARKAKDSEELTDHIHKMVNKMKSHHLDNADADIRSISRTLRSTSLDPFEDDGPRSRSRQRARLHNFTYGIGKH